jgi:hypothetical protein
MGKQACHAAASRRLWQYAACRRQTRPILSQAIVSQAIFSQGLAVNLLGKRSENYSGRDTKSPESTSVMAGADPLAARELPKAIILPRQGHFLPNLTASRRSFIWRLGSPPDRRHSLSGERQQETTSDSDAGHRFTGPIFQDTP